MTTLLQQAFDAASELPEQEQDAIAAWILNELVAEQRWLQSLASSAPLLERLAGEAIAEHRRGETQKLDPNKSGL